MRSKHQADLTFIATACLCVALGLAQAPAYGRHPDLDLDALSDGQLGALIQAELDDNDLVACGIGNPNAAKTKEEMFEVIMCALGDDGDDESEQSLDFDDLEDEMEEAGTTVEDVVMRALERADVLATGPQGLAALLSSVVLAGTPDAAAPASLDGETVALKDGRINPGKAALVPVKGGLIQGVRAR
jgi:hypothetical protein